MKEHVGFNYLLIEIYFSRRIKKIKDKSIIYNIQNTAWWFYYVWIFVADSAFASVVGVPVVIASSVVGLKICVLNAGIKKCKSVIKKREKSMIEYGC